MTVMTTQPPLPLIPAEATEISAAAAMIEDHDGGRVYVHGNLSFAWNVGDTAGRRFAAVSVMRIKAATQVQVAAAFGTSPLSVWRWAQALSQVGVSALVPHRAGPQRASKLTPEVIATIADLRKQGLSLRVIGERTAVSEASVRRALDRDRDRDRDRDQRYRNGFGCFTRTRDGIQDRRRGRTRAGVGARGCGAGVGGSGR